MFAYKTTVIMFSHCKHTLHIHLVTFNYFVGHAETSTIIFDYFVVYTETTTIVFNYFVVFPKTLTIVKYERYPYDKI